VWKALNDPQKLRLFDYVFALPLIVLSVLRGEVGPDTPNYIETAQGVIWWKGQRTIDVEFGYVLLMRLTAIFTSSPALVVAVISLLTAILFFTMLHMWENGRCTISLVFIPLCYFPFTMNTLRVGIAFPLAVIAILQLEKRRFFLFGILALASISMQMTVAILLPMVYLARPGAKISRKGKLYGMLIVTIAVYLGYRVFGDIILYKLLAYSLPPSLESNSGFGPLLLSVICSIISIWFCEKPHRYLGFIFLAIQVAFYTLTAFSYAGLRLQSMALFAQVLALFCCAKRPISGRQLAIVLLLCCLASFTTARNFIVSAGEPSAFIPYHFAWEHQS
jgi:hypothetical protein